MSRNIDKYLLNMHGDNGSGRALGRGKSLWGGSMSIASQISVATLEALLKTAKGGSDNKMPTKNQWFHQVCLASTEPGRLGERGSSPAQYAIQSRMERSPRWTEKRCA